MKYTFCEMIYNNGTSSIDTGIYPDSSTTINITIKNENTGSTGYDAVYVGNSGLKLTKYGGDDEYIKYEYGNGSAGSSRTIPFWAGSTAEFQLSNTGIVETTTANTWEEQITMTEFTATGDTIKIGSEECFASFGKCVIKKNGVIVANLSPCTLGNLVGMYDSITETFKSNTGFTAIDVYGDMVLGDGATAIESINIGSDGVRMIYIGNKPFYANQPLVDNGYVKAIFETTYPNQTLTVLSWSGLQNYTSMNVDGVDLAEVVQQYTFANAGRHTVILGVNGTGIYGDTIERGDNSRLVAFYIGEGITALDGDVASFHNNLKEVYFPSTITSTGRANLYNSPNVERILGPKAVDGKFWGIGNELWCMAFAAVGSAVTIPEQYTVIQSYAFASYDDIRSITFHSGITAVASNAFDTVRNISELVFEGTTPPSLDGQFNIGYSGTMYVPNGCSATYAASDWGYLVNDYEWTIVEL